jgi:hypothetical protein
MSKYTILSSNRIIRILRAWFQTICADLITSTFTAAGIVPDRMLYGTVMSCKVDLDRSIHMKDMLPDALPEEATGPEDGDDDPAIPTMPGHSLSAPISPKKKPVKRHKLLKLEQQETPKKKTKPAKEKAEEVEKACPPETIPRQLTLDQCFKPNRD